MYVYADFVNLSVMHNVVELKYFVIPDYKTLFHTQFVGAVVMCPVTFVDIISKY